MARITIRTWLMVVMAVFTIVVAGISSATITTSRPLPFLPDIEVGSNANYEGHGTAVDFLLFGNSCEAGRGMPVVASQSGYVVKYMDTVVQPIRDLPGWYDSCGNGWGNTVVICSSFILGENEAMSCERYAHMRDLFVLPGQRVQSGQVIGLMGNSGRSTAPHLHTQLQSQIRGLSIQVSGTYDYTTSATGSVQQGLTVSTSCNDTTSNCFYSTNESLFSDKVSGISSSEIGTWQNFGWLTTYESCDDGDTDQYFDCDNERNHRHNAYVSKYSGGLYGQTYVVYDALSGATQPYIVRSGMLIDADNGWNSAGSSGPTHPILGMPIEDERSTFFGSEQCFQWGCLTWDSAESTTYIKSYPHFAVSDPADQFFSRSVGPGVFSPSNVSNRLVHHWDRSVSYKFADAWGRNGAADTLGYPVSDNAADPGVHLWHGTRFLVQNFAGGSFGDSAIMYDPQNWRYGQVGVLTGTAGQVPTEGWNKAYVIRTGFWQWYRYNDGIKQLKAPIGDESNGTQQFLCGWLEWNSSTQQVVPHIEPSRPGCSTSSIRDYEPRLTGDCYVMSGVAPSTVDTGLPTGGGGEMGPMPMSISCSAGPVDTTVSITGPVMNGLVSVISGSSLYLEYASTFDGSTPYMSGKPRLTWMGDLQPNGLLRTYYFILGANVKDMQFFVYNPDTATTSNFDMSDWDVVGDCFLDSNVIRVYEEEQGVQGPCVVGDKECPDTSHYAECLFDPSSGMSYWNVQECGSGMQCLSAGVCTTVPSSQCSYGDYACASSTSNAICIDGQWQYYNCASDSECLTENGFCSVKPQVCSSGDMMCTSSSSIAICQVDQYTGEGSWLFFNCAAGWECLDQNGFCSVRPEVCFFGDTRCVDDRNLSVCVEDSSTGEPYMKTYPCEMGYTCSESAGVCIEEITSVPEDSEHTVRCENKDSTFVMTFSGPIQDGLWGTVSGLNIYLEYGSYADGWSAYQPGPSSKPYAEWIGDYDSNGEQIRYQMELEGYVDEMNFFLYSPDSAEQQWGNLDWGIWEIVGDCYQQGSSIRHIPLSSASGTINCVQEGSYMRYEFEGPMLDLLVGEISGNVLEIHYGSNTDGWSVPTTGKPVSDWLGTRENEIVLSSSVNAVNFYLHSTGGGAWFDLVDGDWDGDYWEVTGDCYAQGGGIYH